MKHYFSKAAIVLTLIGTVFATYYFRSDKMLYCVLTLSVLDYTTGVIGAVIEKNLNSNVSFNGICKKILMYCCIYVAYMIDYSFGGAVAIKEVVVMFYIANEGISLLENCAKFIPMPERLKEIFIQIRRK